MKIRQTAQFKKDLKKCKKRGLEIGKLKTVTIMLLQKEPLPVEYRDHALIGEYMGCR